MRKNLLKQLTLALLLTVAVPTLNAQVAHIGDILCQGDLIVSPANYPSSGATAIGVVFYVDNTGQHGWAIALQDAGGTRRWCNNSDDTPLPNYTSKRQAIFDLDGYQNTQIVRQCGTNYLPFYAVNFENGWYVPTIGQLSYLYGNLVEVNAALAVAGGAIFPETGWTYWSSTEFSGDDAWYMNSSGELDYYGFFSAYSYTYTGSKKRHYFLVRGARNF